MRTRIPLLREPEILDAERRDLGAAQRHRETDEQDRTIALRRNVVVLDGEKKRAKYPDRDRANAPRRGAFLARDAFKHVANDSMRAGRVKARVAVQKGHRGESAADRRHHHCRCELGHVQDDGPQSRWERRGVDRRSEAVEVAKVRSVGSARAVGLRTVGIVSRTRNKFVDGGKALSRFGEQRDYLHSNRQRRYASDGYILR